jgi:membrane protease YdiL (CAAX protease family)
MMKARVGAAWYATPLIFPILITVVMVALRLIVSEDFALGFELLGIPIGLMAGFFEEIGWTGYALPRMLGKRSALLVAVGLGLLQTSWQVPCGICPSKASAKKTSYGTRSSASPGTLLNPNFG